MQALLCWARPTPPMPGERFAGTVPEMPIPTETGTETTALTPKPEYAAEYALFYSELSPVRQKVQFCTFLFSSSFAF